MKKLVIVESPSKSKTIEKYLGNQFEVVSSKGHIRDLAIKGKDGLGVDVANQFQATYVVDKDKSKVVKELKSKAKKAETVYLATDPDREGEAISWHLAAELGLDVETCQRVVFNEITKDAILKAFDHPRTIDLDLVRSQETRRILDRIIGFKLSKLLQSKIKSKSAGRVQSVALKLVVEREKEIDAFVPVEYWSVTAQFEEEKIPFEASLSKVDGVDADLKEKLDADKILAVCEGPFTVSEIKQKKSRKNAKPPFITSTLQQEMSTKYNFAAKKTMRIAQKLYEGVQVDGELEGLITYMRTDSTRLSDQFVGSALHYIETTYGKNYVGFYKVKNKDENAQDAHEAIRPTHLNYTPAKLKSVLTPDELKVYSFIYDRTLASLMAPAKLDVVSVSLTKENLTFATSGSVMTFDGYTLVYGPYEQNKDKILPKLTEGQLVTPLSIDGKQHFTKGPSRYSEASLIKEMESNGIGRPSTYATIIDTLQARGYVELVKSSEGSRTKVFIPTDQGKLTDEKLQNHFKDFINVKYTAYMEDELDEIAEGKRDQVEALQEFYDRFIDLFDHAKENMEKLEPQYTGEHCPKCGLPLVIRKSRTGEQFVGCSGYPECDYVSFMESKKTGEDCPDCGSPLIERKSRKGATFVGCSAYPSCTYIKKEQPVPTGDMCPQCGSALVKRKSRYGKYFVACSGFPKCRYIQKDAKKEKGEESES